MYRQLSTARAAMLHGIIGTFMPVFMLAMLTRFFGANRSWREGLEITPFALFAGLAFTVPYTITGVYLGPEFPSLLGALVGTLIVSVAVRRGWLMPRNTWEFSETREWPSSWSGSITAARDPDSGRQGMPAWLAWLPYVSLAALLVLTRLPQLPVGQALRRALELSFEDLFGTGLRVATNPLYLPGTTLLVVVLLTAWLHGLAKFLSILPKKLADEASSQHR